MIRTGVAVLMSVAAAGMIAVGTGNRHAAAQPPSAGKEAAFKECAKACDDCARICDECAIHCARLIADGHKHHMATLQTCVDCADVCQAASSIVVKQGPFSDLICVACADACKRCGDACEKHGGDDPVMKRCAEECRKCEKACRDMLKHIGGGAPPAPGK